MSLTSFNSIFSVENQEYGFNPVAFRPISFGGTVEVRVPKITGNIKTIGEDTIQIQGLFSNAPECKPSVSLKVNRKNTITAKLQTNCNWLNKINSEGLIPANTQFAIDFVNGDLNNIYLNTR